MDNAVLILTLVIIASAFVIVAFRMRSIHGASPPPSVPSPPAGPRLIGPDDLQSMWGNRGLLNTSLSLDQVCQEYSAGQTSPCTTVSDCTIPDCSDYRKLNQIIAPSGGPISCFSLATSLQRKGLAQMVFGPTMQGDSDAGDMTVGLFLDVSVIEPYIACMAPIDSGSIARYGSPEQLEHAFTITANDMKTNYSKLLQECKESSKCGLYLAGCAASGGDRSSDGYHFVSKVYDAPLFTPKRGPPRIPRGWVFIHDNSMQLFDRDSMDAYVETTRRMQNIMGQQHDSSAQRSDGPCSYTSEFDGTLPVGADVTCPDYWTYQFQGFNGGDGYKNNEVDLFVPQTGKRRCAPSEDFVKDFRNAVVGVYATPYCGNTVAFTKDSANQCCTSKFSKSVAKALADKYNASSEVTHHINAYFWKAIAPDGPWDPTDQSSLSLQIEVIS